MTDVPGVDYACSMRLNTAYTSGPWLNSGVGDLTTTYRDPTNTYNVITVTRAADGNSLTVDSFDCTP